jgi:hypothetical protein
VVGTLHSQVEEVVDHQHLRLAALEATGVDDAADDDLKAVDAAYPGHRNEDSVTCEQLDDQALDSWWSPGGPSLHDDVAFLPYLIPSAVEDWQAPDT